MEAHGVHLAVTDVLYSTKATSQTEEEEVESESEGLEDIGSPDVENGDEEEEDVLEETEGFILEENVTDEVLPDLTEEYEPLLQKVRKIVKFFRCFATEFTVLKMQ